MRTKKALKQLSKTEALIRAVADRYTPRNPHLQELLDSASATIGQAKGVLDSRSGQSPRTSAQATNKQNHPKGSETAATPELTGNKTDFVLAVVEAHGLSGATAREIDEAFTIRRIDRSKNLIYNALNALVKQKKLKKQGDRYFSASLDSNGKSAPPKKRISPEGLKRIIEANKRRWAQKKTAHTIAGQRESRVGNRSAVARKPVGRRAPIKRVAAKTRA